MRNQIITLIFLLLGLSIHAQSKKSFTPTKGEIIFKEISKITDRKVFDETLKVSKKNFKESLINSLLKEPENKGREKEIEQMAMMSSEMLESTGYKQDSSQIYHHQYTNSKIRNILSRDQNMNFVRRDEIIGNQYEYSGNIILNVVVDKKNKKKIHGYDCYKVTYEYKENEKTEDENFMKYAGNMIYKREMWVTDKIKSLYHPIIYEKEILKKFYPLAILETQSDVKGFERKFVLQKITLE
ncbi:hypothetical protein OF897_13945 [Chryseobacterium formosus]|uniref:GLPGLI family protein n=1 Tax=Chryseobacterium formosus TaxID=1537363 RepID=A0ABT3XTC3_9FLAO|nr:hypothetical protein [Chryseobacterium formosus]MCX8525017.1 hypothetical protein [Chryseobacterium formosus]